MFMRDHAALGAAISLTSLSWTPDVLTAALFVAPVALASHLALDLLGEHSFGSNAKNALIEVVFLAMLGAVVFSFDLTPSQYAVVGLGVVMANLPDITDSRLYLTYVDRKRWPHRGWWVCHQRGYSAVSLGPVATLGISGVLLVAAYLAGPS